jgi:hypothetical protein
VEQAERRWTWTADGLDIARSSGQSFSIAVQSGWGVDAQRMQAQLDMFLGTKTEVPQGGVIWVYRSQRLREGLLAGATRRTRRCL